MLSDRNIHFMAIEGTIGVGKTSLARAICERWNAMFIEENFADNPFLPKFYEKDYSVIYCRQKCGRL